MAYNKIIEFIRILNHHLGDNPSPQQVTLLIYTANKNLSGETCTNFSKTGKELSGILGRPIYDRKVAETVKKFGALDIFVVKYNKSKNIEHWEMNPELLILLKPFIIKEGGDEEL